MSILFLDLETTGTDPQKHSILEVAAEFHKEGKLVTGQQWSKKFSMKRPEVDLGALKVNGHHMREFEHVADEERCFFVFVDYLLDVVKHNNDGKKLTVCGHNVAFDINFLTATLKRYNVEGLGDLISYKVLDTATIAEFLRSAGLLDTKKTSLEALAKKLDIKLPDEKSLPDEQLHNAPVDVKLTAAVYYKMIDLVKGK